MKKKPLFIWLTVFILMFSPAASFATEVFTSGEDWVRRMSKREKFLSIFAPYILYYRYGVPFRKPPHEYIADVDKVLLVNPYLESEEIANIFASTVYAREPESRPAFHAMAQDFEYQRLGRGEWVYPRLLAIAPPSSQDSGDTSVPAE